MRPKWSKLASLVQKTCPSSIYYLFPRDNLFKNIFHFTTAGDWVCVLMVKRLPVLHCIHVAHILFHCSLVSWIPFVEL